MAAVHFTTIPCELNTANRHIESHIFCEIRPCTNNIAYARFEDFGTFHIAPLRIGKNLQNFTFKRDIKNTILSLKPGFDMIATIAVTTIAMIARVVSIWSQRSQQRSLRLLSLRSYGNQALAITSTSLALRIISNTSQSHQFSKSNPTFSNRRPKSKISMFVWILLVSFLDLVTYQRHPKRKVSVFPYYLGLFKLYLYKPTQDL